MERQGALKTALSVAGATGAIVSVLYAVGAGMLSLRYVGMGLSGQRVVGLLSRNYAFFTGARSFLIWGSIGGAIAFGLGKLVRGRKGSVPVLLALGVPLLIVLVAILHVWWPLVAAGGLLAIAIADALEARRVIRAVIAVLAFAGIAITYEADRLSFGVDRVYVQVPASVETTGVSSPGATAHDVIRCTQAPRRICGLLISHDGQGIHLAVASDAQITSDTPAERLVFIPERSVELFSIEKARAHLLPRAAAARRKPLRHRIFG